MFTNIWVFVFSHQRTGAWPYLHENSVLWFGLLCKPSLHPKDITCVEVLPPTTAFSTLLTWCPCFLWLCWGLFSLTRCYCRGSGSSDSETQAWCALSYACVSATFVFCSIWQSQMGRSRRKCASALLSFLAGRADIFKSPLRCRNLYRYYAYTVWQQCACWHTRPVKAISVCVHLDGLGPLGTCACWLLDSIFRARIHSENLPCYSAVNTEKNEEHSILLFLLLCLSFQ